MAFYQLEPFGPLRDDYRAGKVAAATILPHQKRGAKPLLPSDFFDTLREEEQPKSVDDQIIEALAPLAKRKRK